MKPRTRFLPAVAATIARDQLWADIDTATYQIRRALVTKYQVDF